MVNDQKKFTQAGDKYSVAAVVNGVEGEKSEPTELLAADYIGIKLDKPEGGTVTPPDGKPEDYVYIANDASVADLDGDGELEIIIKWDSSNSRDSSHLGATGPTMFDAYKLDGTKLWRINLGINARSGAHDTQFLCADFNDDGKGEIAMRTADGTVAGDGTVIGDGTKDWRDINGKNLSGPLYLTVFNGETGAIIDSVDYYPQTKGERDGVSWDVSSWDDDWGNRSERYNACVFYENGKTPSMMFARGYYAKTVLAAFSMVDNKIVNDWIFDTDFIPENERKLYMGKGNHSVCVSDVDYDGKEVRNPDLSKKSWDIAKLYEGDTVKLAVNEPKALINDAPYYIDGEDNTNAPYITNERTMVPMRFIAEAFGAYVTWDDAAKTVAIKGTNAEIKMSIGSLEYSVNGKTMQMDAAPEITKGRTFVPLRAAAEALGMTVEWNDNGVIVIGDNGVTADADAVLNTIKTVNALQPNSDAVFTNGEKMMPTQSSAIEVYTNEGDGEAACDINYDTAWKSNGKGIIMMKTDKWPISAVIVKFADGKKHPFVVYTRGDIRESDKADISDRDGWTEVVRSESDGSDLAETFIFSVPKYSSVIKLELLDDEPCEIAELGAIGVQ